jgi:hypothetical protein
MGAVMTNNPDTTAKGKSHTISMGSAERAPFIYFDGISCFGTNNGAVQIELASNVIVPHGPGVRIELVITAHLRCSPASANKLRHAIDKALAMLEQGQNQAGEAIPTLKN